MTEMERKTFERRVAVMASKKSYNERIDDIQKKMEQLKAQEKALKQNALLTKENREPKD